MIDCKPELVTALNTILPTYYEWFADSKTSFPCITYRECENKDYKFSEDLGYSNVSWYIKIWGDVLDNGDITTYAGQVDDKMRELGYSRKSSNELVLDKQMCKVMIYEALGKEYF